MVGLRMRLFCSSAVLSAVLCVTACTTTRNGDGSITVSFAPDMAITTWGLEDALDKLTELLDKCITGNYDRPCTNDEMREINKAIQNVLNKKDKLKRSPELGNAPC